MGRVIELSDEQYQTIERVAAMRGQSPDALLAALIAGLSAENEGVDSYDTDEWFQHLGATEEQIAVAEQIAQTRSNGLYADP
jgi:hypothetical protein